MNNAQKNGIDYLFHAERLLNRPGYSHNIVTGCKHHETDICNIPCYAREMVEHGRLKNHPTYPYGFKPTFHPERVKAIGGAHKLIFLNDMGDNGGDWYWFHKSQVCADSPTVCTPELLSKVILEFATINPQHIILLLTKNPAWYGLQEWPDNCYCGFTATNNREFNERCEIIYGSNVDPSRVWVSFEPWLDESAPMANRDGKAWLVIGGLTGKGARAVSEQTQSWISNHYHGLHDFKLFVKNNAYNVPRHHLPIREYPNEMSLLPNIVP